MSWTEALGFALALVMVVCSIRELHWSWPLAIASSVLYFFVFRDSLLYAEASLQIVFAVLALWGAEDLLGPRAPGFAGAIDDMRANDPALPAPQPSADTMSASSLLPSTFTVDACSVFSTFPRSGKIA